MRTHPLKILILILLAILFLAPPCLAKAKGYFYVSAYSYRAKKAYVSTIFVEKVKKASYSDEEYCTDVDLLQKIELAFQEHMTTLERRKASSFTLNVRGAYKSYNIAKKRQDAEVKDYKNKGLTVKNATRFKFK